MRKKQGCRRGGWNAARDCCVCAVRCGGAVPWCPVRWSFRGQAGANCAWCEPSLARATQISHGRASPSARSSVRIRNHATCLTVCDVRVVAFRLFGHQRLDTILHPGLPATLRGSQASQLFILLSTLAPVYTHKMAYQNSILSRPLSVYSIPPELLDALSVRAIQAQGEPSSAGPQEVIPEESEVQQPTIESASGLGCQTCPGASFGTPEDQRAHFKSDWHRYNTKAKLNGRKTVTADEWDNVVDGRCIRIAWADVRRV